MMTDTQITPRKILGYLLVTAAINTVIAFFLTGIGFGEGLFQTNLLYSQAIGLAICLSMTTLHALWPSILGWRRVGLQTTGIFFGSLVGLFIASMFYQKGAAGHLRNFDEYRQVMLVGILFGTVVSFFFLARERLAESRRHADQERIRRLTSEKRETETHLKLLQAQVEPHFLFNTLSTVISLLDTDPSRGRQMLVDLTAWLRTSLARSRRQWSSLGEEIDALRTYLAIFRIRLCERLEVVIYVPDTLHTLCFPPMLVQPLVENALLHGIDPKIEGGEIRITARTSGNRLRVVVADTGVGTGTTKGVGVGLSNTRERLAGLYGAEGKLIITENRPCGLKVAVEVPLDPGLSRAVTESEGNHEGMPTDTNEKP